MEVKSWPNVSHFLLGKEGEKKNPQINLRFVALIIIIIGTNKGSPISVEPRVHLYHYPVPTNPTGLPHTCPEEYCFWKLGSSSQRAQRWGTWPWVGVENGGGGLRRMVWMLLTVGNAPTWLPELSKPLQSEPQGWPFPSWAGGVYCCSWIHIHEQQVFLLMPQLTLDLLSNTLAPVPGCLSHRKSAQRRPASPLRFTCTTSTKTLAPSWVTQLRLFTG